MKTVDIDLALQKGVSDFFAGRFPGVKVIDVRIEGDEIFDGERVIEISVTFEGTPDQLVQAKPPGLVGMLRERLEALRASAFPVLNFIPAADARV